MTSNGLQQGESYGIERALGRTRFIPRSLRGHGEVVRANDDKPKVGAPQKVQAGPNKKNVVKPPKPKFDVMLVPNLSDPALLKEHHATFYGLLYLWSQKWKEAGKDKKENREIVLVDVLEKPSKDRKADLTSLIDNVKSKYKEAHKLANGGQIIHALGHGDAQELNPQFDMGAQLGLFKKHILTISMAVFEIHKDLAKYKRSVDHVKEILNGVTKLTPKLRKKLENNLQQGESWVEDGHDNVITDFSEFEEKYKLLEDIGKVLTAKPAVSGVTVITCNIGKREEFVQKVANKFGVPITCYDEQVVIMDYPPDAEGEAKQYRDDYHIGINVDGGRHEIRKVVKVGKKKMKVTVKWDPAENSMHELPSSHQHTIRNLAKNDPLNFDPDD